MARRRSPPEVWISASMTGLVMGTFSEAAMCERRRAEESVSSGVKRNLEQREARGSIILRRSD